MNGHAHTRQKRLDGKISAKLSLNNLVANLIEIVNKQLKCNNKIFSIVFLTTVPNSVAIPVGIHLALWTKYV